MFGRKRQSPLNEIDVAGFADRLDASREFLRMWTQPEGEVLCLIDPAPLDDPFAFGIALTDCVRHGAKAYAGRTGMAEGDALARIWAGIDAERAYPTDLPTEISSHGTVN